MYTKISGMTGTAMTEEREFFDVYNIKSIKIPTNHLTCRKDENDLIFQTVNLKYENILKDTINAYKKKQPILIFIQKI